MGPNLPGNNVGVTVTTVADTAGLDETKAGLADVEAQSKTTGAAGVSAFDSFNSSLGKLGSQMTDVGKSLTTYISLPIAAIAAESVKMAMNFQQSMELLVTNAGVSQSAIAGLSSAILAMSGQVGQSPEDLATAMYHIASAGQGVWSAAQQLDILKTAAEGAAIGQASLDDTTYALTSALASNVKGASDASQMMATLVAIVGSGDMHMQDLNAAIGTGFLGTAAAFGVSIQSVGAALATLGDNGEQGAAAATRLRMMMSLMASPSAAAAKVLGDLGLTTEEVSTATGTMSQVFQETGLTTTKLADDLQQPDGITVAIQDLQSHLEDAGMTASQTDTVLAKAFGGGRTDAALLQLLQNTDRLNQKFQDINASTGNFATDWAEQQATMKQQWDDAWSGIEADMVKLGVEIMPDVSHAMHDVADAISDVSNWFQNLSAGNKQFVIDAIGIAAAAGPVLLVFGTLAKSLSSILTLTKTVGSGFGLLSDGIKALSGAGGEIGISAELAGGGEAGAGLLATLGPIALAVAAVGAASIGTWYAMDKLNEKFNDSSKTLDTKVDPSIAQFHSLMKDLNISVPGTASQVTLLGNAQGYVALTGQAVTVATKDVVGATATNSAAQVILASRTNDVNTAQANVKKALDTYGQNSPQYQKAVNDLSNANINYDIQLQTVDKNTLNLITDQGNLSQANKDHKGAVADLANLQSYLNSMLSNTIGVIAKFGPTAIDQVTSIDTLQQHLGTVVNTWNGLNQSINVQQTQDANIFQGLGSTIDKIQGQDNNLNANLGASIVNLQNAGASLQGSKIAIPHNASGSNNFTGGLSVIGENGPELMNVPSGATIYPAGQTSRIMSGSGSGGGKGVNITQTNYNYSQFDLTTANRELAWRLANLV